MSDYNYGSDDSVHLGDQESENHAGSLAGYSLDVRVDPTWPGTSADPNKTRVDPDKLKKIADDIDKLVVAFQDSSVTDNVTQKASNAKFGPGTWHAATYLQQASTNATTLINQYTTGMISNLSAASAAIRAAAGGYGGGEQANVTTANNQQSASGY